LTESHRRRLHGGRKVALTTIDHVPTVIFR
jgi:hypothetical protein